MIKCPCCNGTGEIEPHTPVYLSRMQSRVWHFVRTAGAGIEGEKLVAKVYADDVDGGPLTARRSISVIINKANQRLAKAGQRIVARGTVYRLEHFE